LRWSSGIGPHNLGKREAFRQTAGEEETMKYGELNLGQVEAIVNKLGGMEGVQRFLSDEFVVKMVEQSFTIWKTITLGAYQSLSEDRKALKALLDQWHKAVVKPDILAGKNAGCKTILVQTGYAGKDARCEAKPDFTAANVLAAVETVMSLSR